MLFAAYLPLFLADFFLPADFAAADERVGELKVNPILRETPAVKANLEVAERERKAARTALTRRVAARSPCARNTF